MRASMKHWVSRTFPLLDAMLPPVVYPSAWILKSLRRAGVHNLPRCKQVLLKMGVFPIVKHYYEPRFDWREEYLDDKAPRPLPGIEWNTSGQRALLKMLTFTEEVKALPRDKTGPGQFYLTNGAFEFGDAEYWYQLLRFLKPKTVIEIGGGYSTLLAIRALNANARENISYRCKHICVEPYEMPWLEEAGVELIRARVEHINVEIFQRLEANDVLFIDSSHIIRPQGDVVFEYLHVLPTLKKGVIVHVHDIMSPSNYPQSWVKDEVRLWNEQYLLEAFLSHNSAWRIIGALNYLYRNHYDELLKVAPSVSPMNPPGSFYIQRVC